MTRAQHIEWCKQRARPFLDAGDIDQAIGSIVSDLFKHEDTQHHVAITLGMQLMMAGHLKTIEQARRWIEGIG